MRKMNAEEASKILKGLAGGKKLTVRQCDAIELALDCIEALAVLPANFTTLQLTNRRTMDSETAKIYGIAINECSNIVMNRLRSIEGKV